MFDKKLAKMGMHQLMAEGSDWDESRSASRVASAAASTSASRAVSRPESPVGEKTQGDAKAGVDQVRWVVKS